MLTKLTGQGVQVNKAVVGRNAFAHEAGIHQDGMLKDRRTYEIMRAEDVGAPWNPLVLGKHSGRHAVQSRCADLGFQLDGDELVEVYRGLMAIADDRKVLTDQDIRRSSRVCAPTRPSRTTRSIRSTRHRRRSLRSTSRDTVTGGSEVEYRMQNADWHCLARANDVSAASIFGRARQLNELFEDATAHVRANANRRAA